MKTKYVIVRTSAIEGEGIQYWCKSAKAWVSKMAAENGRDCSFKSYPLARQELVCSLLSPTVRIEEQP